MNTTLKPTEERQNPRFVWLIGAIGEAYAGCSDTDTLPPGMHLWDRQEQKIAVTVHPDYSQMICLETTESAEHMPLTNLEHWMNADDDGAFESEGIVPTKPEFKQ
jgi:hypothetical protein